VTRTLDDEDLDGHVAGIVARLASFDGDALATAKAMVNRTVLPPRSELQAAYRTFEELAASPSYRARAAAGAAPSDDDQLLALERDLGSFIGAAARRRATGV
jgi:hypothetical protein